MAGAGRGYWGEGPNAPRRAGERAPEMWKGEPQRLPRKSGPEGSDRPGDD